MSCQAKVMTCFKRSMARTQVKLRKKWEKASVSPSLSHYPAYCRVNGTYLKGSLSLIQIVPVKKQHKNAHKHPD